MKLIVGLGNPGEKYKNNRHNVGFMFADFLVGKLNATPFKNDKYLNAEIAKSTGSKGGTDAIFILLKPQMFMNRSGEAVRRFFQDHKSSAISDNLFVAHDDLDIPFGKFKIQKGVGPKLHNGIESIENAIGTKDFYRIRIGVENRSEQKIPGETYVLQNFAEQELKTLHQIFDVIYNNLTQYHAL